jgi:hypothetical protein
VPGETRTVTFELTARDLSYYDVHRHSWVASPGKYRLEVGSSSRDIRQQSVLDWVVPTDARTPPTEGGSILDLF